MTSVTESSIGADRRRRTAVQPAAAPRPGAYHLFVAPQRVGSIHHGRRPGPTRGHGVRADRRVGPDAMIRCRRILLGIVAAALLVILALPWGGAGGRLLATPGSALAGAPIRHHALYIVQPGDSLWSIAERLDPGSDPRPLVARLARQAGGDKVIAGERLMVP